MHGATCRLFLYCAKYLDHKVVYRLCRRAELLIGLVKLGDKPDALQLPVLNC